MFALSPVTITNCLRRTANCRRHVSRLVAPQIRQSLAVWGTNSLATGAVGFRTASVANATARRRSSTVRNQTPGATSIRKASTLGMIEEDEKVVRRSMMARSSSFIIPTDFSPAVTGASSRRSMVGAFTPGGLTMSNTGSTEAAIRSRQSMLGGVGKGSGLFPAPDESNLGSLKVPKVKPDRDGEDPETSQQSAGYGVPGESQVVLVPRSKLDEKYLGRVFMGLFVFYMVVNIDNGALPASLPAWEHDKNFNFSNGEIGILGAIGYVGMIAGAPLSGFLFGRYPPKNILLAGFVGNTCMVYLFGGAPNKICLFVARFMIGFTQACIFVFAPVWVDNFASDKNSSLWMALMQAANPLGVMLGYLLSIIVQSIGVEADGIKGNMGFCPYGCSDPWFTWRIPFLIQAVGLTFLSMVFSTIKNHYIDPATIDYDDDDDIEDEDELNSSLKSAAGNGDIHATPAGSHDVENGKLAAMVAADLEDVNLDTNEKTYTSAVFEEEEEEPEDEEDELEDEDLPEKIGGQMLYLLSNPIYVFVVLTLSTMYFVVTGIQFWVTKYLTNEDDGLGYPLVMVGIGFAVVSATSPVAGVIFGGKSVQRIGGYKNVSAALQLCSYFAAAAVLAAVATAFITIFWLIMVTIWLLLFFGGAIVPVLTGILMATTPQPLQPLASSMSITVFQILGYTLAPVLCGVLAEMKSFGLRGGFRVVLFWSGFGLLFNYCSTVASHRRDRFREEKKKELKSLAMMGKLSDTAAEGGNGKSVDGANGKERNMSTSIVRKNPLANDEL